MGAESRYRAYTNKTPSPLRIFDRRIFPEVFIILKNPGIFFLALIILKKIPPAAGSYYYIFLRRPNLGPPGVDFLNKICVFP